MGMPENKFIRAFKPHFDNFPYFEGKSDILDGSHIISYHIMSCQIISYHHIISYLHPMTSAPWLVLYAILANILHQIPMVVTYPLPCARIFVPPSSVGSKKASFCFTKASRPMPGTLVGSLDPVACRRLWGDAQLGDFFYPFLELDFRPKL